MDAKTWIELGQQQLQFGSYQLAVESFDLALTVNPNSAEAWDGKASALKGLGNYGEAIAASEQAIAIRMSAIQTQPVSQPPTSTSMTTLEAEADFWFNQARQQFMAGDFESAIASLDQALLYKPDDYVAWASRGAALDNSERYEEAISSYDQALLYKPDSHQVWCNRGLVLSHLERYEEAISSYDQALFYKPDGYQAQCNRGDALNYLGRYEEAIL